MKKQYNHGGYVALISVLVVGAVSVTVSVSLLLLGVGSARTGFAVEQSKQAASLADACVEEALQQIRNATLFTGSGTLSFGQGACTYTVTSQGGQNRTIDAVGTVGSVVRKDRVVIDQINPRITVVSWREVP